MIEGQVPWASSFLGEKGEFFQQSVSNPGWLGSKHECHLCAVAFLMKLVVFHSLDSKLILFRRKSLMPLFRPKQKEFSGPETFCCFFGPLKKKLPSFCFCCPGRGLGLASASVFRPSCCYRQNIWVCGKSDRRWGRERERKRERERERVKEREKERWKRERMRWDVLREGGENELQMCACACVGGCLRACDLFQRWSMSSFDQQHPSHQEIDGFNLNKKRFGAKLLQTFWFCFFVRFFVLHCSFLKLVPQCCSVKTK